MKRKLKGVAAAAVIMLLSLYIINFVLSDTAREVEGTGVPVWFTVGEWPDVYWGLLDSAGNEIVPPMLSEVRDFSEGFAAVAIAVTYDDDEVIDEEPDYEYESEYEAAEPYYDGYISQEIYDEYVENIEPELVWGFIDTTGRVTVPFIYEEAMYFHDNRAAVMLDGLWGFVSSDGHVMVPIIYDEVSRFSEGLAAVRTGHLLGYIDRRGNMVIPAEFDIAQDFNNGYALVGSWTGHWGVINSHGEEIVKIEYSYADILTILDLMARPIMDLAASVEQLHWREVRRILPLHTPIRVTDVRTGIYYYVQSLGNGNHADVEPSTAADTALLFEAFGGVRTWTGRPVWVTIDGRVFPAAIHSVPHDVSVVSGNNMNGHVCLHFYGSTTHVDNREAHRHAILEAQRIYELHRVAHGAALAVVAPVDSGPSNAFYAAPETVTLLIDGQFERFQAYNMSGHYFIALRDLAYAFNRTPMQFGVEWGTSGDRSSIQITRGQGYEPVGGEMNIATGTAPLPIRPSRASTYIDGERVQMLLFNIDGRNVVLLPDFARIFGLDIEGEDSVFAISSSSAIE